MSAVAGPSRGPDTWHPTRYLEPNHPDNEEVLEQAAYQAAITRQPGERAKRYKPRKAVDFMGGLLKWRQMTKLHGPNGPMPPIHPNPSDIVGLLPPEAHRLNPSTSVCDHFVHTSINKERSPIRIVQWTPDARRLLTGNDKGQFTLWNGSSFNYESITQVHDDSIRAFAYSHNGQALLSVDRIGMIKYFTPHLTNIHGFQGHREACHGAAWSPNDEKFVTGGDDGLVKIWSYREAKEESVLSGHGWDVRCVDWHPQKGLVVSGSKDMLVKFWDPRSGKDISTLHSHKAVINSCKWNPQGHLVATAGGDGLIRLFDIRTFRELDPMKGHSKEVNCLEWHPIHNNILASGDAAGALIYWSLLSPDPSAPDVTLEAAHDDAINTLAFHPLGHLLCTGSKDFTARFWSRARPVGGHETDRYHLGEEKALQALYDGERALKRQRPDDDMGQKGLPGLGSAPSGMPGPTTTKPLASSVPGFGGLPGLGAPPPSMSPPMRSWGNDPPSNSSRAPLPSQGEMLRNVGSGDPRGAPTGRAPLPAGYGNDRMGPSMPPPPPPPPNGYGSGGYGQQGPPGMGGPFGQGGYRDSGGYGGPPNGGYGDRDRYGPRDPYDRGGNSRYGGPPPGQYGGQGGYR